MKDKTGEIDSFGVLEEGIDLLISYMFGCLLLLLLRVVGATTERARGTTRARGTSRCNHPHFPFSSLITSSLLL